MHFLIVIMKETSTVDSSVWYEAQGKARGNANILFQPNTGSLGDVAEHSQFSTKGSNHWFLLFAFVSFENHS